MIKHIYFLVSSLLFISCSVSYPKVALSHDQNISLEKREFSSIATWKSRDFKLALKSFSKSCKRLRPDSIFYETCQNIDTTQDSQAYFEKHFTAYEWKDPLHDKLGLMTGYYEPLLYGSLCKDENHTVPLLKAPKDLIKIYLSSVIPELKGKVVRGRLVNNKIVPYYDRKEISLEKNPENVICWLENKVELFFLQIQGSGRIQLDTNKTLFVGYGDKNGHPYRSIGKYMIEHKIMSYGEMSLQGIKAWADKNPEKIDEILNQNPSYLFFTTHTTPAKGAMGVVLTPKHSLAVDTKYIPLGAPLLINTSHPLNTEVFSALAIAQDRGAAIKGERRLDFFWGFGEKAAQLAGHTKSRAEMIILLPKDFKVSN